MMTRFISVKCLNNTYMQCNNDSFAQKRSPVISSKCTSTISYHRSWQPFCDVSGATCWVLLAGIWKWSNFSCSMTFVDVAWCCSRLARFVQQCYTRACVLIRFSTRQTRATCCAQQCCDLLRLNVAIVWPGGACKCLTNIVGICCVEMLRSFGPGLIARWIWINTA